MVFDYYGLLNTVRGILYKINHKKLVVFGTGSFAKLIIEYLPDEPSYYVDNESSKHNCEFAGSYIYNPNLLLSEDRGDIFILVASIYYDEISLQLRTMGFIEGKHFEDARPTYDLISEYKRFGIEESLNRLLSKEQLQNSNLTDNPETILASSEYEWLGLSKEKLCLLGFLENCKIVFLDDTNDNYITYFDDLEDDYRSMSFKGINLYDVSAYSICVDLDVFINDIDPSVYEHKDKILKWYNICANYITEINEYLQSNKVSGMILVQGYCHRSAVLRQLAINNEIPVLSLENTFNKNKSVWDDISGITVNKNLAKNYYWRYKEYVSTSAAQQYSEGFIRNVKMLKTEEHTTPLNKLTKSANKKTIVYIGQVFTDSSVLFGIWNFKDPVEIIKILVDYCIENDFELILKLHPKEYRGTNFLGKPYNKLTYSKMKKDMALMGKIKQHRVTVDSENEYDTYSLIDNADACITINSQAGLEALIKGKDVILCGNSFYGGLGFTYDAVNESMLINFLDMVLKNDISLIKKEAIHKFFYIFSENYCIDKTEPSILKKLLKFR